MCEVYEVFILLGYELESGTDDEKLFNLFNKYYDTCCDLLVDSQSELSYNRVAMVNANLYVKFYKYLKLYCETKNKEMKDVIIEMKKQTENYDVEERSELRNKLLQNGLLNLNGKFCKNQEYTLEFIKMGIEPLDLFYHCQAEAFVYKMKNEE